MRLEAPNKDWFIEVDSLTSLVAYRKTLTSDVVADLKRISLDARQFAETVGDRYVGGFPITLETMVAHAKAHGQLETLRSLVDSALHDQVGETGGSK